MKNKEEVLEHFKNHPAEKEDLQLRTECYNRKEIARIREVSPDTVRTQFIHIHEELEAHDDVEAVIRGLQYGITVLPDLDN